VSEVVSQDKARYCELGTQSVTVGRIRQAAAQITRGQALLVTEGVRLELGQVQIEDLIRNLMFAACKIEQ
jgi:hypothetical protein